MFAVILVLWVLNAVVAAGVTRGALALVHRHSGQFTVQTATGLLTISMALVTLPLTCLSSAAAAVGYHDLRVNREGAGLEELVRVFE